MAAITWISWILGLLFLGLGGLWFARAVFWDRARGRRRCPRCWYDMAGVPGLTCPECGRDGKRESRFGRTRRHRWQAVFASVVIAAGFFTTLIPAAMEHGFLDIVPTPVLRVVLGYFGDDAEAAHTARGLTPSGINPFQFRGRQLRPIPLFPGASATPPVNTTTWQERLKADWDNLLVASHARRLLLANIRSSRGKKDGPTDTISIGYAFGEIDDERRVAFDAVTSLAKRTDGPIGMQRDGIRLLIQYDFGDSATRRVLRSIARSKRTEPYVRFDAIDGLQRLTVDPAVYIRSLREMLESEDLASLGLDGYARRGVRCVLELPTEDAIEELLTAIESDHLFVRQAAMEGFQKLGESARSAIPRLTEAVRQADAEGEIYALHSLIAIGEPAVASLVDLMGDVAPKRRVYIASTLRVLKRMNAEAIEIIARDLLDPEVPFSRYLLSIGNSYGEEMRAALAEIPVGPSLEARKEFVLLYVVSEVRRYPETVLVALGDPDRLARRAALYELQHMASVADRISVPIVDALAWMTDPRDQRDLIRLVRQYEIDDERVLGLLVGRSGSERAENLGYHALFTLHLMCEDRSVVIDEAIRLLEDRFEPCRILAAGLLGRAGADAERALPALRAALERDDLPLDEPAAEAIEAISDAIEGFASPGGG